MATIHRTFDYRVPVVTGSARPSRIAALRRSAPANRARIEERSLEYRHDFPVFFAIAACALALLGALGHALFARSVAHGPALQSLPLVLYALALAAAFQVVASVAVRRVIRAETRCVVIERASGWPRLREVIAGDEVTAALVVGRASRRRVVLVGARNVELATVFRERYLDPPALAHWFADAVVAVVESACRDTALELHAERT